MPRRRSAATNKKIMSRKPTAQTQKAQILALNKKVNANTKKLQTVRYTLQHSKLFQGTVVSPYLAEAIMTPSTWGQVFGAASESGGGKYTGTKLKFNLHITPRTEHTRVDCTVIFCSPKNQKVVYDCGGHTSSTCLPTQNTDYTLWAGMALMNKKRWNVHKVYRLTTLPLVTEAGGVEYINSQVENRRYFTMKNPLKINNRTGDWNTVNDQSVSANQRVHCFVFNDNLSSVEGSPSFHCSVLATGFSSD